MSRTRLRSLLILGLALTLIPVSGARALRIATYNILNYSAGREALFRTVLEGFQPDVIVVEEILSQTAVDRFRDQVLDQVNPGEWEAASFVNGDDTDNALYWRTAKVDTAGHYVIGTALRDIDEWTIRPEGFSSSAADVRIYVVHLKASQGSDNETKRRLEVQQMRNRMETFPPGQSYLITGDFNIYRSSEPAYQDMTSTLLGAAGVVQDPIDREGNWHVNPSFADIHTQSPRTELFGGGANGGLDDRFDMILVGPAVQDGEGLDILDSTYTALGQDGLHFDGALNVAPFGTVVDSVLQVTLHDASDHLPVFADFQVPALLVADAAVDFGPAIRGGTATATLSVANGSAAPADELDYSFEAPPGFTAPAGSFEAEPGAVATDHVLGMDTAVVGAKAGDLVVTTDDPDRPAHPIPLSGSVLDHAEPSVDPDSVVLATSLDLGYVAEGDTAETVATVHNFGYGPLQALLDVHDAVLAGDPRFHLIGGFTPALVGGSPVAWSVGFDAAGAASGSYEGTLTFSTRDQTDLSGAIPLADLTFDLTAAVQGGGVAVLTEPSRPDRTGLASIAPNPFRPSTDIHFELRDPAHVRLDVYDVRGRRITTLVDGARPTGVQRMTWDGRSAGLAVPPGIYFVRLQAGGVVETRKITRLR
jgi:endonuclease/exonuclease/phosphatase family metal-dependent hydrolase